MYAKVDVRQEGSRRSVSRESGQAIKVINTTSKIILYNKTRTHTTSLGY